MKKYGLLGYPLSHTMSPYIHKKLFQLSGIDAEYKLYEKEELNTEEWKELVQSLDGFNITIPHKNKAIKYLSALDPNATQYQAVNTVKNVGETIGYNTDVDGLIKSIETLGASLSSKVLILGAGGAAQTAVVETARRGGEITIAVRRKSFDKAEELIKLAREVNYVEIDIQDIEEISGEYDLLINCTPVGMYPNVDECPVSEEVIKNCKAVFDLIYNPHQTKLLSLAQKHTIPHKGGMSMLVYQAAKAHQIWYNSVFDDKDLINIENKAEIFLHKHFQKNNMNRRFVFIGFMASGKTTLAKFAAETLHTDFVDIDEEIAKKEGITIPSIFKEKGEAYFRKTETEVLQQFLEKENIVISVGGGAPLYNKELLSANALTIYIDTPFELCYERIVNDGGRPVAADKSKNELLKLYAERDAAYNDIADIIIDGSHSLEQKMLTINEWI